MQWSNWTSSLVSTSSNTAATTAVINSTLNNPYLPPVLLILTFAMYVVLTIAYTESPGNGKFVGITAIVLSISLIESVFGLIGSAVLNIIIFLIAFFLTGLFKSG